MIDLKCFITQQPSEVSIRSKGITTVAYIDYQQWQDIVRQFQSEKEKVCCLRDQFLYDKRYQYPCKSCGQYQHNIFNCPQVCFKVNRTIFFNKLTHYVPQDMRMPFARRDKKKQQQSFISNEIIRQGLKLFRWQMVKEIYEDYEETDIQQECAMIEKDREFYLRCPKIKLSYFKKKEKQRYIIQYNSSIVKFRGKQISKQKSDSNFYLNQNVSSSSSSSSFISSTDSEESSSGSELPEKEPQHNQQQEQNQNNSNSNNLLSTPNTNLNQTTVAQTNVTQPTHIQLDSRVEYSEVQTEGVHNANQYHKKSSSELQFQNNHFHPRHSKTMNNGRTPKSSRVDNFEGFSQNINSPFPQQIPNPSYFYEQNSQKNMEDNLNPQTYLNYPQQQLVIADKTVNHRRSILSNSNMTMNNYNNNNSNKGQYTQPSSFQPKEENQNGLKLNYENSRSLQDDDPYIQASSQINSLNTPQQQDPSGSPVINLNQIFNQFQYHIQGFYHQIQGIQNHQNQFFPDKNGNQQNMQLINKRKKRPMTRFNLPSNLTPNERSQSEGTKDHFRQTSLNSSHKTGGQENLKENSKVEFQQNEKQKYHLFGKFEFYFDFPKEFMYYYPKYNQSNILKSYKKYQTMVMNQYKESLTMSKKGTSASKYAMHQSTRRKFPKKHSLAYTKNKKTFLS